MTVNKTPIIWFTGMSGSGKSTLSTELKKVLQNNSYSVQIIDGDTIRDNYTTQLGFGRKDVFRNNMRIAKLCLDLKDKGFNIVLVPVISPYEEVRKKVRSILRPNLHLIYVKADIDSLKKRDTKGLYSAADKGIINDLIGYSEINPYDEPKNAEIVIDTSMSTPLEASKGCLLSYIKHSICN